MLKDNVFYIGDLNVIVIAELNNKQALLWNIFGPELVDLDDVLSIFSANHIKHVMLGFTPLDTTSYQVREVQGDDILFILDESENPFAGNQQMFPLLSHA